MRVLMQYVLPPAASRGPSAKQSRLPMVPFYHFARGKICPRPKLLDRVLDLFFKNTKFGPLKSKLEIPDSESQKSQSFLIKMANFDPNLSQPDQKGTTPRDFGPRPDQNP